MDADLRRRRGRPPKPEPPTICTCIVCKLADLEVEWPNALPIIAKAAGVAPSKIDPITARLVGLP